MKNLKLLTCSVIMAGILLTTGCVKNEEADGVKALRTAQASLLQARATNETTVANAEAAFLNAQAAVEQAKVAIQEAQADAQVAQTELRRIQNAMAESQNQHDIAILAMELADAELEYELSQSQIQSQIDLLLVTAEKDLAAAQKDLEIALSDYAAELAADAAKNKNLDEYLDSYKEAMLDVIDYRGDVIQKEIEIAEAQINNDNYGDDANLISLERERLVNNLAILGEWQERYITVVNDPSVMEDELLDAVSLVETDDQVVKDLDLQLIEATSAIDAANKVVIVAKDAYGDAKDYADDIDDFSNTEGLSKDIPEDALELIIGEDQAGAVSYNSIVDYDDQLDAQSDIISDLQDARGYLQNQLSALNALYNAYASVLDAAQNTRDQALVTYHEAIQTYNEILLANGGDATASAVITAETAMTSAETDYNTANTDLTDLKNEIDGAALENGVVDPDSDYDWDENYYSWVGNNDHEIQGLIETIEEAIEIVQADIVDENEVSLEIQADKDVVVAYIAYMEDILGTDPVAAIAALKATFIEAKEAYMDALKAKADLADERDIAADQYDYADAYATALEADYDALLVELEGIEDDIATIENSIERLDNNVDSWADYIALVLEKELEELQTLLAAAEEEAAHYQGLINSELGVE